MLTVPDLQLIWAFDVAKNGRPRITVDWCLRDIIKYEKVHRIIKVLDLDNYIGDHPTEWSACQVGQRHGGF
ncbi:hypothetical protein HanXRQr2_Chr03g0115721 [Helianthus annuus]|uniref:Uncharacterized protein n=1 Tax=Helianthus annuus TaxID=4232 RepID=A0A9K3JGU1_HELAN|nr:hypothetical protein HanXRQr2_Chr03g0115721 [Helianthus annuus]KAJ0944080.1 hypothetical protein HanPSC8_Chr03g0112131 [Helianthus annuus]